MTIVFIQIFVLSEIVRMCLRINVYGIKAYVLLFRKIAAELVRIEIQKLVEHRAFFFPKCALTNCY